MGPTPLHPASATEVASFGATSVLLFLEQDTTQQQVVSRAAF